MTCKIRDILKDQTPQVSFEIFPPKTDAGYDSVLSAAEKIAALKPSFISVTYGAGGGTSKNTVSIASHIKDDFGVTSLAHLTCVSSTREEVHQVIDKLKEKKIDNILALRGDIPKDNAFPLPNQYRYACELIEDIKQQGDFCIGAACYPEGHVETEHKKDDISNLKTKVDCGVDFLTTQMFFDNNAFYSFMDKLEKAGIDIPVHAGIMPVTAAKQLGTSVTLSGSSVPVEMSNMIAKYGENPEDMKKAGIEYAVNQILDLKKHGVAGVHIYSMNKADVTKQIYEASF